MNILVTGVSKGLGLEIARVLLKNGNSVYGISRTEPAELHKSFPETFHWKSIDLTAVDSLRDEVLKQWIGLDTPIHGLVDNAAIAYDDIVTNANLDDLEQMYKINVFSPIMLTKLVIRQMLLHNVPGSLVHISSISTKTGYKGLSMYASTKGALEAFSKNVAREWGSKDIRSNCVAAGFMETEMSGSLSDEQRAKIYARTALKKPVNIDSVAETTRFLLSSEAQSITGQTLLVDNGTI